MGGLFHGVSLHFNGVHLSWAMKYISWYYHWTYFVVISFFIGHERLNFHGLETNEMPMISP